MLNYVVRRQYYTSKWQVLDAKMRRVSSEAKHGPEMRCLRYNSAPTSFVQLVKQARFIPFFSFAVHRVERLRPVFIALIRFRIVSDVFILALVGNIIGITPNFKTR